MSSSYTKEELEEILNCALDAIAEGLRGHVNQRGEPWHLPRDLAKLDACCPDADIKNETDYWGVIIDCLEAALKDPVNTYKKPEKPICSHKEALNLEMFAFVVQLDDFTRKIYTKFCLKSLTDGTWYISIDCHT